MSGPFRAGQRVKVINAEPYPGSKGADVKPPFKAGDIVEIAKANPHTVALHGFHGLWKTHRFVAA